MSVAVEKLLKVAKSEIGYLEKASNYNLDDKTANAGNANYTKYARDLDKTELYNGKKNGYYWCDVFVDWCFVTAFGFELALKMTYQPKNSAGAGCTSSASYYKSNGKFFKSNPQPGDQIFFTKDGGKTYYHTGIVVKIENNKIYTIEGNTSSASGVVENGGSVRDKSYSLTYKDIGGYGRPNYSLYKENTVLTESTSTSNTNISTKKVGTVIAKSGTKCRSSASSLGKFVGAFNYGAKLSILKSSNGWYYVTGTSGWGQLNNVWVNSKYVQVSEVKVTSSQNTKTTTENLNYRTGRGTSYPRIGTIPKGTKVQVSELVNNWYKVIYNGKTGYASANYLK